MPDRIYSIRRIIDPIRQPTQNGTFNILMDALNTLMINHPYELDRDSLNHLESLQAFSDRANGPLANPLNGQYLYRICSVTSIANYSNWRLDGPVNDNANILWNKAFQEFIRTGDWASLSLLCYGPLSNRTGFTWWTDLELKNNDEILPRVHRIGVPNLWISKYSILLRMKFENGKLSSDIKIPTCVDAFESAIFHSRRDDEIPHCGYTIDLNRIPFIIGVKEYCVKPIPINNIQFYPVIIEENMRKRFPLRIDKNLYDSLIEYYSGLK